METVPTLRFIRYAVISADSESDAIKHIKDWAASYGIETSQIIGWDFPFVSQEQINVYRMHGYVAACIIAEDFETTCCNVEIITQAAQRYAVITIKNPFNAPFSVIPNAYKLLLLCTRFDGTPSLLPIFDADRIHFYNTKRSRFSIK